MRRRNSQSRSQNPEVKIPPIVTLSDPPRNSEFWILTTGFLPLLKTVPKTYGAVFDAARGENGGVFACSSFDEKSDEKFGGIGEPADRIERVERVETANHDERLSPEPTGFSEEAPSHLSCRGCFLAADHRIPGAVVDDKAVRQPTRTRASSP